MSIFEDKIERKVMRRVDGNRQDVKKFSTVGLTLLEFFTNEKKNEDSENFVINFSAKERTNLNLETQLAVKIQKGKL